MILIDQRPSRITEDAIANCNTIITFHLQQQDDKNAVIAALGYSPYDPEGRQLSAYLSTLTTGQAIVKTQNSPYPYEIRTTPPEQPANPTRDANTPENKPGEKTPQLTEKEAEALQLLRDKPLVDRSEIADENTRNLLIIGELTHPVLGGAALRITHKGLNALQNHQAQRRSEA
jgi:DNA helicase HerA-like ATPase